MKRQAYIAKYDSEGNETVLMRDSFWSPRLQAELDHLAQTARIGTPLIEGWYYDEYQVECMGRINMCALAPRHS